ncbi:MAG: FKBP-type peptidyl-prolyl cis-trans isomerase [Chlorobi bacterium]|nr:FKBP-type peptidyl-prolyl cis-trans isomerase [Chlorobiota bacterium]
MKYAVLFLLGMFLFGSVACQQQGVSKSVEIKTKKDTLSYAIGQELGANLKKQDIDVNVDVLLSALKTAYLDTNTALTAKAARDAIVNYQTERYEVKQEEKKKIGAKNKAAEEKFLAENKKKEGVKTTNSGLQYKVLKSGSGKKATDNSVVTVNYRGKLLDGTEFDSSFKNNKPATFNINRVIPGWTEVLKLMREGDKFEVYIPSRLAYGFNGSGDKIGPNELLIFEIELLKVDPKPPAPKKGKTQHLKGKKLNNR